MNIQNVTGFDWDEGNSRKNEKHEVSQAEAEQVFLNMPLLLIEDSGHSRLESRFLALGTSDSGRRLHITFTLREDGTKIRPISARAMSRKERVIYEKAVAASS